MADVWACVFVFAACLSFGVAFSLRGKKILFAALGGSLSWAVYLAVVGLLPQGDILANFVAAAAVTLYSELMARRHKTPASVYLVVSFLPLVPGSGIYYTMEYGMAGDTAAFLATGLHTVQVAGAIVVGIVVAGSFVRVYYRVKERVQRAWARSR